MKLTISFKHMDHTPALDERIREKSERLEKYFQGASSVQWVCWVEKNMLHSAEIQFFGPKMHLFAQATADNMYKALDMVVEKLERQLEKKHDQWTNKIHMNPHDTPKEQEIRRHIADEGQVADEDFEERTA